ncbi:MAG: hypothetical protein WBP12_05470 [Candidatus Saccharimonas sp.]
MAEASKPASNNPEGFITDSTVDAALAARVAQAQVAEAASRSNQLGPDLEDEAEKLLAMGDHGTDWLVKREGYTRNSDGTYTAPDGPVYSWDGHVIPDDSKVADNETEQDDKATDTSTESQEDENMRRQEWEGFVEHHYRTIDRSVRANPAAKVADLDGVQAYQPAAIEQALIETKQYTQEDIDNPDIFGDLNRAAAVAAYQLVRDRHIKAAKEEHLRIGRLEDEDRAVYDAEQARLVAAKLPRLNRIVDEDKAQVGPKKWHVTSAQRKALVVAGIYSHEFADGLTGSQVHTLFQNANTFRTTNTSGGLGTSHRATRSGDQGAQQPPVDPEQEKKDKIAALIVKIGIDKVDIVKLVIGVKDPADMADDAKQSQVIRDTLKTLGILTDADFNGLEDADIVAILQSASPRVRTPPGGTSSAGSRPRIPAPPGASYPGTAPGQQQTPPPPPGRTPGQQQVRIPAPPGAPYPGTAPGTTGTQSRNPNARFQAVEQTTHLDSMLTNVEASLLDRFDDVRDKWAKISSKRQRRMLFGKWIARSSKYKAIKHEYDEVSRLVGRIGLKEKIDQAQTQLEKVAIATTYWIAEQNAVREKAAEYTENRTWWKVVNRVSTFMNKGNKITRIAKRATLGLVAGAAVAATGATATGLAAGLVFFSTEQAKDLTGGIGKLTPEQEDELRSSPIARTITGDAIFENRAEMFAAMYEKDSSRESNRRLGKFAKNAAKGALAGAAAWGIHEGVTAGHDYFFGSDSASAAGTPDPGTGGGYEDASNGFDSGHSGQDAFAQGGDHTGYGAQDALASPGHEILNSTDAYYVRPGEGWFETFQDMGIPKEHWAEVLQDAGPKLHDLGVADFNSAEGQWWIAQSGNLKPEVLQTIADSSAKFGYAFKPIA